jgi:hypothetical protein
MTKVLQEDNPSEDISDEVSDAPCFATPEDQFQYWREQFLELVNKAHSDGVFAICALVMIDPIARSSEFDYVTNGDVFTAIGAVALLQERLKYP